MADGTRVSAKSRTFEDPGVLRLRQSAWETWHLRAPQWHQGRLDTGPGGGKTPAVDQAELDRLMEELGL